MKRVLLVALIILGGIVTKAEMTIGVARKAITPTGPVWMAGYASRNRPSEGVMHDLWAKALVVGDDKKIGVIIVTTDIIGFTHEISGEIAARVRKKYGIRRSQLLLNASHTHSGPVIRPMLSVMYDLAPEQTQILDQYRKELADKIVEVIDMAVADMEPAVLSIGHGSAGLAVNRRQPSEKGVVIGVNPGGPVDKDVPVLKAETKNGKLKAILFGYACHNTTLDGYQISGDYAGFAQIEIEKTNPGTIALFLAGCGADQNPDPRRTVELAAKHGKELASAVQLTLGTRMTEVNLPVRTSFKTTTLNFAPFTVESLNEELKNTDKYRVRRAGYVLDALGKGVDAGRLDYPVQAVRFADDFTILALSDEVVVGYSLKTKSLYPDENLFVAGYSNEVECYIPTRQILSEGGYEPETSMIYYGKPGPLKDDTEDRIFSAINSVMRKTGIKQ